MYLDKKIGFFRYFFLKVYMVEIKKFFICKRFDNKYGCMYYNFILKWYIYVF